MISLRRGSAIALKTSVVVAARAIGCILLYSDKSVKRQGLGIVAEIGSKILTMRAHMNSQISDTLTKNAGSLHDS